MREGGIVVLEKVLQVPSIRVVEGWKGRVPRLHLRVDWA